MYQVRRSEEYTDDIGLERLLPVICLLFLMHAVGLVMLLNESGLVSKLWYKVLASIVLAIYIIMRFIRSLVLSLKGLSNAKLIKL